MWFFDQPTLFHQLAQHTAESLITPDKQYPSRSVIFLFKWTNYNAGFCVENCLGVAVRGETMPKQSAAHPPLCLLPSLSQSHTLESALQAPEPPFRLPQASLRRDLHSPPLRANFTYHSRPRPYPATRDPTTPRNPSVFQRPAMRTHGVLIRSPVSNFHIILTYASWLRILHLIVRDWRLAI
jgi:hypothetical protein